MALIQYLETQRRQGAEDAHHQHHPAQRRSPQPERRVYPVDRIRRVGFEAPQAACAHRRDGVHQRIGAVEETEDGEG